VSGASEAPAASKTRQEAAATRLGVNFSFCVKRRVTPQLWARLVREELGLDLVQLSFDLVDPTWPDDLLAELEVFYPFERDDASVLSAVKRSVELLEPAFA